MVGRAHPHPILKCVKNETSERNPRRHRLKVMGASFLGGLGECGRDLRGLVVERVWSDQGEREEGV